MRRILCLVLSMVWVGSMSAQTHLFRPELRDTGRPYVFDFIERYFDEISKMHNSHDLAQKLFDDKVFFAEGTVSDIHSLTDTTDFSLNCINNRYYEAVWSKDSLSFLTVLFPISFELLLGLPKNEIEKTLFDEISHLNETVINEVVELKDVMLSSNGIFQTIPKLHYQIETLNNCRYYRMAEQSDLIPIFDSLFVEQSIANLFHLDLGKDYRLNVEQGLYGFKTKKFVIGLNQWIAYCQKHEMNIYVGIEEEERESYKVLVISECEELGFNHLLSVKVPKDIFFNSSDSEFKAKLNAYIPTHNVKNLYQQYKKRAKREIKI